MPRQPSATAIANSQFLSLLSPARTYCPTPTMSIPSVAGTVAPNTKSSTARTSSRTHHQYGQRSAEALHALCTAESSRWRRSPYARRRGIRRRILRRNHDGIDTRIGAGRSHEDFGTTGVASTTREIAMNKDQVKGAVKEAAGKLQQKTGKLLGSAEQQ